MFRASNLNSQSMSHELFMIIFLPSHLQATGTLIGFEIVARRLVSSAPRGAI